MPYPFGKLKHNTIFCRYQSAHRISNVHQEVQYRVPLIATRMDKKRRIIFCYDRFFIFCERYSFILHAEHLNLCLKIMCLLPIQNLRGCLRNSWYRYQI
jgi:hypothetical protein